MRMKREEKIIKTLKDWQLWRRVSQLQKSLSMKLLKKFTVFVEKRITKRVSAQSKLFYKDIYELPLLNFIECLVNKNFEYLYKIKPKKYFQIAELKHFESILLEYSEAMSGGSTFEFNEIIKFYNLISKIRILEAACGMVTELSQNTKRILKKYGINITGNYEKDYIIITGKIDTFKREIESVQAELNKKESESKNTMSFEYFTSVVSAIRVNLKIHLDMRNLTVADFCSYFNELKKQVAQWQKNQLTK